MNVEELQESAEHAHHSGQKGIGLTTAIVAVLLATTTLLSHRAHTEEIKLQTKVNDGWAFYQAKHERAYIFGIEAEKALLNNQNDLATRYLKKSIDEECGAPVEKGCTSPHVKGSPPLQQFLKGASAHGDASHESGGASPEPTPEAGAATHEKTAQRGAHKEGATDIQDRTWDLEKETELVAGKADFFDASELFLEISIVLCSIALLAEAKLYWRLSFLTTALGVGIAIWGWFLH